MRSIMACARSLLSIALAACGSPAAKPDAAIDAQDKSLTCATSFGSALTNAHGRLDGTVVAIVPPNDQACAEPNMTHLVVQVAMGGAAYRMVVDVKSDTGANDNLFEIDHPLVGDAWSDGWHTTDALDYPSQLGVHSPQFVSTAQDDLVARITSEIELGAHLSVYSTSAGEPDSTHLVHRGTVANEDGAIVIDPDGAQPHWILITFAEYVF